MHILTINYKINLGLCGIIKQQSFVIVSKNKTNRLLGPVTGTLKVFTALLKNATFGL